MNDSTEKSYIITKTNTKLVLYALTPLLLLAGIYLYFVGFSMKLLQITLLTALIALNLLFFIIKVKRGAVRWIVYYCNSTLRDLLVS